MRLLITTPTAVVADHADVVSLRAEDESGSFGILRGHAEFLTALRASVLTWRHEDGRRGCCAVRRGVLTVTGGAEIAVATREARLSEDLDELERVVIRDFEAAANAERSARIESMRLHMKAVRQILRYLRPGEPLERGGGS